MQSTRKQDEEIKTSEYDKSNWLGILICFSGVSALVAVMAVMAVILAFKCGATATKAAAKASTMTGLYKLTVGYF